MTRAAHSAFLLLVGNELLTGKIVDTNGAHATAGLRAAGIALLGVEVVPDDIARIASALQRVRRELRPDVVITSGGVGPTHDDMTMQAVAVALGRPMVTDPLMEQGLRRHYGTRINDDLLTMARVPQGCELVYPEPGAFPLFSLDGGRVWCLPGEPGFFTRKFDWLVAHLGSPGAFAARRVHCACDEGQIAALMRRLQEAFPDVAIGSYPRYDATGAAWWTLVTLDSRDPARADALLDELLRGLPEGCATKVERG
ncbi:MAG: competence/damage-inducible protein A [Planctomycetota bacterium]